nr:p25 protein [Areca palm velarivirus 1]UOV22840.1 p25 protein [Areca palm velarivirus 1]
MEKILISIFECALMSDAVTIYRTNRSFLYNNYLQLSPVLLSKASLIRYFYGQDAVAAIQAGLLAVRRHSRHLPSDLRISLFSIILPDFNQKILEFLKVMDQFLDTYHKLILIQLEIVIAETKTQHNYDPANDDDVGNFATDLQWRLETACQNRKINTLNIGVNKHVLRCLISNNYSLNDCCDYFFNYNYHVGTLPSTYCSPLGEWLNNFVCNYLQ